MQGRDDEVTDPRQLVIALRRDNRAIVRTWKTDGGVNGWSSAIDDMILVPVGVTRSPALLALGLPS